MDTVLLILNNCKILWILYLDRATIAPRFSIDVRGNGVGRSFLKIVGCLCLVIQAFCNDIEDEDDFNIIRDIPWWVKRPSDDLFRESVLRGDLALCEKLLVESQISEGIFDEMFFEVLFIKPEFESTLPLSTRISLGKLLVKYGELHSHSWLDRWVVYTNVFPAEHPEVWKILISSVPEFEMYHKCALINCLVRRQCYETYSDYPAFLRQLRENFGIVEDNFPSFDFSSFLPKKEALEAYIEFCNANNLGFSSNEEMSQFIEKMYATPPETLSRKRLFSSFLGLIDADLGLTIQPTIKSSLLMDFFLHQSAESYYLDNRNHLLLAYFANKIFEKQPLCALDPKVVIQRIFADVNFEKLERRLRLKQGKIRTFYAWYHLLNTPEVQDYVQNLPNEKKAEYQKKIELLSKFALQEGSDRYNLVSIMTKQLEEYCLQRLEFYRKQLTFFKGGTIERCATDGDNYIIELYRELNEEELQEFSQDDIDDGDTFEFRMLFLKGESPQFDELSTYLNEDAVLKIFDVTFEGDNQVAIGYCKEGETNPHVIKIRAERILHIPWEGFLEE